MNNHVGPKNPSLKYTILPRQANPKGEFNWGSDWVKWCERNCIGNFAHNCRFKPDFETFFLFENKDDAFRFKMSWG